MKVKGQKDRDWANRWTEQGLWVLGLDCDSNCQGQAGKGGDGTGLHLKMENLN